MRWLVVVIGLVVVGAVVAWQARETEPSAFEPVVAAQDSGVLVSENAAPRIEQRTLVVKTRLGGAPRDVGVSVTCDEAAPVRATTSGGEHRFQVLGLECVVRVEPGALAAAEAHVELTEAVTEVELELLKSARLTVTTNPVVEGALVSLSGPRVHVASREPLPPVPEGEYDLRVQAKGYVTVDRPVSLRAGENTIEVMLREATRFRGLVRDEAGAPVSGARVVVIGDRSVEGDTKTDEQGTFELPMRRPGELRVRASRVDVGETELTVTVPNEDVAIVLAARGVLELEIIDVDGKPLVADAIVRAVSDGRIRITKAKEPGLARVAGLEGGEYVIERSERDRVPISKAVTVVEGRVVRMSLQEQRGVRVTGRVLDHRGKPATEAGVGIEGRGGLRGVDEKGEFVWDGVPVGPVKLYGLVMGDPPSPSVSVEAPAQNVVIRLEPPMRVSGRVIDERGRPVRSFQANDEDVESPTGRFDVRAPYRALELFAEGYAPTVVEDVLGELGDVVMHPEQLVRGEVVDADGAPVAGASVIALGTFGVQSDANGQFSFSPRYGADLVTASRGTSVGTAPISTKERVRIVLQRGAHVTGQVLDGWGRGLSTTVIYSQGYLGRPQEVDTDVVGRFELDLPLGRWEFSTFAYPVARVVELQNERVGVTLQTP
jgi:protocatechuate 3,4-dioxygenase beta subunit